MLLGAMKVGIDAVKKSGVKKLLIETENYKLIKMLQQMNLPIEEKKKGKMFTVTVRIN